MKTIVKDTGEEVEIRKVVVSGGIYHDDECYYEDLSVSAPIDWKKARVEMEDLDKIKVRDYTKVEELNVMEEKKEGWAKVRKDINLYDTKEEADRKMIGNNEYVTAKVCLEE